VAGTKYLVFTKDPEGGWYTAGEAEAPSSRAAIAKVVAASTNGAAGTYVAVPERSWQPVNVATKQAVTFS
jgi:hypothetical protein